MPARTIKMLSYIRRPDHRSGSSVPGSPPTGGHDSAQHDYHQQLKQQSQQTQPQRQDSEPRNQHQQHQRIASQPHVAPLRLASKLQTLDSAKQPIPKLPRYTASPPSSAPAASHSFGLYQAGPRQRRARASSEGPRFNAASSAALTNNGRGQHDAWEDSTVNSLLESDANSVAGHLQQPPPTFEARAPPASGLPVPPHRLHPVQTGRVKTHLPSSSDPEHPPFVIGDGGLLKVIDHANGPGPGISATTVNSSLQSGILAEAIQATRDPYAEESDFETTPKKQPQLKHSKLSIRPTRDPSRDTQDSKASLKKRASSVFSRMEHHPRNSPERLDRAQDDSRRIQLQTDHQRLSDPRSTLFYDVDTPAQTTAPGADDEPSDTQSQGEEATITLRSRPQSRLLPPSPTRAAAPFNGQQPMAVQNVNGFPLNSHHVNSYPPDGLPLNGLRPAFVPSVNGRHGTLASAPLPKKTKRRMSPDYDDHMLHRMSYSELKGESFDHDPARVAVQPAKQPSMGDSLSERLEHYKSQDENAQHHFFTQMSVAEWDECGDWFLERFSEVVGKVKTARREKRKITAHFEEQISAREEMVRGKMEFIENTLQSLKQEGEVMMKGKQVED